MDERELAAAVGQEIAQADGWDSDELATNREKALEYYFGRPSAAPSMAGRSSVQSLDVADMHGAVLAAMMPALEIDDLCQFEALSEEDVDQARLESDAVNHVVMQSNDGYMLFKQAIHDALLLRNGLIKIYVDQKTDTSTDSYEGLTDAEAFGLSTPEDPNTDIEILEREQVDGLINITVKRTINTSKLKLQSIDPTVFIWSQNHDALSLQDVQFCAEKMYLTRSELRLMGFPASVVDDLAHVTMDTKNDTNARNRDNYDNTWAAQEPSQETIEVWECYYRVDFDDDGIAELRRILYAHGSNKILENEDSALVPYASGTAWINPHRFTGLSMYDRMKEVQDAKTRILRQWLDNQNNGNNARIGAVEDLVTLEDLVNSRPGGVVRMSSPDAIVPIPVIDVGASCESAMGYLDTVRSERGGASLDLQTRAANVIGDTASGIERQFSSREQQTADMLRTLSETLIKETYRLVHTGMRVWLPDPVNFKARGNWQSVDPSQWTERERLNIKTGLSAAERRNKMQELELVIQQQKEFLQAGQGGVITDDEKLYNAIMDWSLFAGIDDAERYWLDPTSEQAMATKQAMAQQAQAEKQQLDKLAQDAITVPAEIDGAKLIEESRQHDDEMQFKYVELAAEQEQKEAELIADGVTQLEKQAMGNAQSGR